MNKHTPGPWIAGLDKVGPVSRDDDQSYGMMIPVAYIERFDYPDQFPANANLIAAAPDLLEALEGYMSAVDMMNAAMKDGINVHGAMSNLVGCEDNARAAIARARGEA